MQRHVLASTLIMAGLALGLLVAASMRGMSPLTGTRQGLGLMLRVLPLLVCAFVFIGTLPLVLPRDAVVRWLGDSSGWRGLVVGTLAGAVSPGGPLVQSGIAAGLLRSGASVGTVVAYLSGGMLWGLALVPVEVGLLGGKIVLARFLSTFFFPPIAGWLAQTWFGASR